MSASPAQQKLKNGSEYKEKGNTLFKAEDFGNAMFQYHCGILEVKTIISQNSQQMKGLIPASSKMEVTEEEYREAENLFVFLSSNLAMCQLKLGKLDRAIKSCSDALSIDPNHAKSLYRRGKAYLENSEWRDLEKSRLDLEAAKKITPDDKAIDLLLARLEKLEDEENQAMRKQYAKMFV